MSAGQHSLVDVAEKKRATLNALSYHSFGQCIDMVLFKDQRISAIIFLELLSIR
jgi:hypothetical protein